MGPEAKELDEEEFYTKSLGACPRNAWQVEGNSRGENILYAKLKRNIIYELSTNEKNYLQKYSSETKVKCTWLDCMSSAIDMISC